MKKLSINEALYKLAAYCSAGERCIQDIMKKLTRWEIPHEEHQYIIDRLQSEKFLDEKRFCTAYVNDKTKFYKWGYNKIHYELRRKNIPEDLIKDALANIDFLENRKRLKELLTAKKKTTKGKNDYDIRLKLIRFAISRGFALNDINDCMRNIFDDYEDID